MSEATRPAAVAWRTWTTMVADVVVGRQGLDQVPAGVDVVLPSPIDSQLTDNYDSPRPDNEGCRADWRRPDGYWHCVRPVDHRGRHHMVRGTQ